MSNLLEELINREKRRFKLYNKRLTKDVNPKLKALTFFANICLSSASKVYLCNTERVQLFLRHNNHILICISKNKSSTRDYVSRFFIFHK